jgi:SAM-dependent methyltransferase
MPALNWISFWDSKHSIYVNARHHQAHYRRIADDMLRYVPPGGGVLDYGCGEALAADRVAAAAGRLVLCEAAPNVRAALTARFAGNGKIEVRSPEQVAAMPAHSFDLIIMHSVAQYLTPAELETLLGQFHSLLKPGGLLVLGDIIPQQVSALTDALTLLRFGAREGFLVAAVLGLVRTVFSSYWRLRSQLGLTRYDEPAMMDTLRNAGFLPKRANENIGHNPARMTFLAWPAPPVADNRAR